MPPPDRGLARLLQEWNAPALPDSLDRRVLEAFRARRARRPLWRRFFAASIRVPLPVALAALLLLGLALWMPRRESPRRETAEPAEAPVNARLDSKPVVTRTNLAGFEPVREMNVTVLPQGIAP